MRPPKYFALYKRLLSAQGSFWTGEFDFPQGLRMESLTGCPDEAMLGIAEICALAHWKSSEQRKGSLSFRELIRRGDEIEQRLHQHSSEPPSLGDQAPLHPNLIFAADAGTVAFQSPEVRPVLGSLFRESVVLFLHTVLSDSNPGMSKAPHPLRK